MGFLATFSGLYALPKWGGGLKVSCPYRERPQNSTAIAPVVVRIGKVPSSSALKLRNRIKPKISAGYLSKFRENLIAAELVVTTSQTSGLAGLQGDGSSRLLRTIGICRQPILTINPLETSRKLKIGPSLEIVAPANKPE
jgi:hypothetical protein